MRSEDAMMLYNLLNNFMTELYREGEITINTHSQWAEDFENALYTLDGGSPFSAELVK